jgi:uncharacterized protein (TIGR01777 family)
MRSLITGGTGFVGRHLLQRLDRPVAILSRTPEKARLILRDEDVHCHRWSPEAGRPPAGAFEGVEAVFHLAGDSVAEGRWTAEKKRRIRESRVAGTRHLVQAIASLPSRPRVLVSASAVGFYGDRGDEWLDESVGPGEGFLADLCCQWEAEALKAAEHGVRVVTVRIGLILGSAGGALPRILLPFRLGVGGRLGHGRQWMPWIHIQDLVTLLLHAAGTDGLTGAVNGTSPAPVTNREFTRVVGSVLRRPTLLPAPRLALRLALGEFADVILSSQRVVPKAAQASSFRFAHPDLEGALRDILAARSRG